MKFHRPEDLPPSKCNQCHNVSFLVSLGLQEISHMKWTLMIWIALFSRIPAEAQVRLLLEDAIQKALQGNRPLRAMDFATQSVKEEGNKLKAAWLPHVQASYQYFWTNDPLNAFGFKLQQAGIQVQDFDPASLNDPETRHHANAKLSIQQAILPLDMMVMRKGMKSREVASQWQRQRAAEKLLYDVKNAFVDLQYLYAALQVNRQADSTYSENERVLGRFIEQGLAKKADAMQVQIERNQIALQLKTLQKSIEQVSSYLGFLMGLPEPVIFEPASALQQTAEIQPASNVLDRSDFKALEAGANALIKMEKATRLGFVPQLAAFGEYNLYDRAVLGFGENAFLAGISLRWNLLDGTMRTHEAKRLKLEYSRLQEEKAFLLDQSQMEIRNATNERLLASALIENRKASIVLADEHKRIIKDRFIQGLEKPVDLMNAELLVTAKKLELLEGIKNYLKSNHHLEFLNPNIRN